MVASTIPIRRRDLMFNSPGSDGRVVVKDPAREAYFQIGEQEHFLLTRLDGRHNTKALQSAFEQRFGQPLSDADVREFLQLAQQRGLLEFVSPSSIKAGDPPSTTNGASTTQNQNGQTAGVAATNGQNSNAQTVNAAAPASPAAPSTSAAANPASATQPAPASAPAAAAPPLTSGSLLHWRMRLCNPDRLFDRIEPAIRLIWTRGFMLASGLFIASAVAMFWTHRAAMVEHLAAGMSWEWALTGWATLFLITTLHECAHGLTCKHYGGRVRDMGFLLMYFLPCLYCNVSDAWLIAEKRHRIYVTLAGVYFEACVWSLAVYGWWITMPGTLVHHVALAVVTMSGVRVLFNVNPLMKLDGYYILSDYTGIVNLRQQALDHVKGHLCSKLWGAARPAPHPRGRFLLIYGVLCWLLSMVMITILMTWFGSVLHRFLGPVGIGLAVILAFVAYRSLIRSLLAETASEEAQRRQKKSMVRLAFCGVVIPALLLIPKEDRASGTFEIRPATRREVRTAVAGFIQEILLSEGDQVTRDTVVARLVLPDLASRTAQKQAEIQEATAKLRLLQAGASQEELRQQAQKVERARHWRTLAEQDLQKARAALREDMIRLDQKINQCVAEIEQSKATLERYSELVRQRVISDQQYGEEQKKYRIALAQFEQAQAEKAARQTLGTVVAEQELAKRTKELADEEGAATLLQAGNRQEEIDAELARKARLEEELRFLQDQATKLVIRAGVDGVITTPRLKEHVGQYLQEGELVLEIEESSALEIETTVPEQEISRVEPGQRVELKARSLPFETFEAEVERVAPKAVAGTTQSSIVVYSRLDPEAAKLRPGMTGYARIDCGKQPVGKILLDRALRYVRTEFWW